MWKERFGLVGNLVTKGKEGKEVDTKKKKKNYSHSLPPPTQRGGGNALSDNEF